MNHRQTPIHARHLLLSRWLAMLRPWVALLTLGGTLTATAANSPPTSVTVTGANFSTTATDPVVGTLSATDPDVGQTHTFVLDAGAGDQDNSFFRIDGVSLILNGVLNTNRTGAYLFRVRTTDSGSPPISVITLHSITFFAVTMPNQAPSFTVGPNLTVPEDASPQLVIFFTRNISPGPGEAQQLTFIVTNDNNSLFGTQPAIAPDGTLTYTPAPDKTGTATVTIRLKDDGGTAEGGVDTSAAQTFTITVTPVNDAPVRGGGTVADLTVLAGSGLASLGLGSLTHVPGGGADEAGQTLTYKITAVPPATVGTIVLADGVSLVTPLGTPAPSSIVTGAGAGVPPFVNHYAGLGNGSPTASFFGFASSFPGGVRVATGDFTGDGVPDIVAGAGPGGGPQVNVFTVSGGTGIQMASFFAFDPQFNGGVFVAAGDVNQDGFAEVIVGPGTGGVPMVRVFNGNTLTLLASFFAFDPQFIGGIFVAGGDLNGDGRAEIVVGGGGRVAVFDGSTLASLSNFAPFGTAYSGEVTVGVVSEAGNAYVLAGTGGEVAGSVGVFNLAGSQITSFAPYGPSTVQVFVGGSMLPPVNTTYTLAQMQGMQFKPVANGTGGPAAFSWSVRDSGGTADGGSDTLNESLTVTVTLPSPPVATPGGVTTLEDTARSFGAADFPFTGGDTLASITISSLNLAAGDTLKLNGTPVTVNQTITAAQIPTLVYAPAPDANGTARSRFDFKVNGTVPGTVAATMTINVTPVNDAPGFALGVAAGAVWTARNISGGWAAIASSADGTRLAAVVSGGQIHTSTNSGLNWAAQANAGTRNWTCIASSADGTRLAAAESSGQIHTSTDSGLNWNPKANAGTRSWTCIASSADGTGLAAGVANGHLHLSADAGETWNERASEGVWDTIASSADGTRLAAVRRDGGLYTSANAGVNWELRGRGFENLAQPVPWNGIASSADGTKLAAVVFQGGVFTSSDSGADWQQTGAPANAWVAIASSADGVRLAAAVKEEGGVSGSPGAIYTSTNSGATWNKGDLKQTWVAIASSADGTKLAAAPEDGAIHTSVGASRAFSVPQGATPFDAPGFANSISPGPANESGQTVSFTVGNDNNAIFSVQPAIAANGTLTFTPAATAASQAGGVATVTVAARDSGGVDSSSQTFTITLQRANAVPTVTLPGGNSITHKRNAGRVTIPGFASFSPGQNEPSQSLLRYVVLPVQEIDKEAFTEQPAIDNDGTLTFTPSLTSTQPAPVFQVAAQDNGGTANGGVDTSTPVAWTILLEDPPASEFQSATVSSLQIHNLQTIPESLGKPGAKLTLNNNSTILEIKVVLATLLSRPISGSDFNDVADYLLLVVELVDKLGEQDTELISLVADFYTRASLSAASLQPTAVPPPAVMMLTYYDRARSRFLPVRSSGGVSPTFNSTANLDGSVSSGRFSVTFDLTSTPKITELPGTVFAMARGAVLTVSGLARTYDGTAKPVTVMTDPPALPVTVTYDGLLAAPTNTGSYTVVATLEDVNYSGTVTNTLVIAGAAVTLGQVSVVNRTNYQFTITGSGSWAVQMTPTPANPATWISLITNAVPFTFTDTNAVPLNPRRFYRARSP